MFHSESHMELNILFVTRLGTGQEANLWRQFLPDNLWDSGIKLRPWGLCANAPTHRTSSPPHKSYRRPLCAVRHLICLVRHWKDISATSGKNVRQAKFIKDIYSASSLGSSRAWHLLRLSSGKIHLVVPHHADGSLKTVHKCSHDSQEELNWAWPGSGFYDKPWWELSS